MKKLIAIILCMLLAAAPMAMAEGSDLKISNMRANIMGTEIALDNIELVLGVGGNDNGAGVHIGINAEGSSVADIALGINSEKLLAYADGISDVYSIDLQTIIDLLNTLLEAYGVDAGEAVNSEDILNILANSVEQALQSFYGIAENWIASAETIAQALQGAVTADGDIEIDGEKAVQYKIAVSEEQMQIVLNEIGACIGELLNQFGQANAAEEIAEILDGGVHFSVDGTMAIGATRYKGEFALNAREEENNENSALVVTVNGAESEHEGLKTTNMHIETSIEDDGKLENVSSEDMVIYTVNEQFAGFECNTSVAGADSIEMNLYLPAIQANGVTEFSLRQVSAQSLLSVLYGGGMLKMDMSVMNQHMSFAVNEIAEKAVNIVLNADFGGQTIAVSMDAAIEASDAAWLKTDVTDTVDINTIDDAQIEKLRNEAMFKLMGLLGAIAGSSESVSNLIGQML